MNGKAIRIRRQLISNCNRFVKEAIRIGANHFGGTRLPKRRFSAVVLQPSGPGTHSGSPKAHFEIDLWRIWNQLGDSKTSAPWWIEAKDSIQNYLDFHHIKPAGFQLHQVEERYLKPLLSTYLIEAREFSFRPKLASRLIGQMLSELDSPSPEALGLIVLEDFEAARAFALEPGIQIRPIKEDELLRLGRLDRPGGASAIGGLTPRSDWWVCEARLPNARGTADGLNRMNDITDLLKLGLRGFKSGNVNIGMVLSRLSSPFGQSGETVGTMLDMIAVGQGPYRMSEVEVPRFVSFWRRLKALVEGPPHYLQIPIRRLQQAGTRKEGEDALIDYVVGLECLLSATGESTELRYRLSVRGCVLLARKKTERNMLRVKLRNLYDLRSAIVHGGAVSKESVVQMLPFAEDALRQMWTWFFNKWQGAKDNQTAIGWIDAKLVS